jgi:hypothetical protein
MMRKGKAQRGRGVWLVLGRLAGSSFAGLRLQGMSVGAGLAGRVGGTGIV